MMGIFYKLTFISLLISFYSCSLLQSHIDLALELPQIPTHWKETFTIRKYKLVYPGPSGGLVESDIEYCGKCVRIELYKSYNSFVLAYPIVSEHNISLPPAAAIFPLHLKQGDEHTLVLTWEAGFSASLFERLWQKGVDVKSFNTPRLLDKIQEKAPDDPWLLDADLIVERMAAYDFSAYDVKLLPVRDVFLEIPSGSWFMESPFSRVFTNEGGDTLHLEGVSLGFHRLFQYASGLRFDMYVTEHECVIQQF
jgi:hypothetical protein